MNNILKIFVVFFIFSCDGKMKYEIFFNPKQVELIKIKINRIESLERKILQHSNQKNTKIEYSIIQNDMILLYSSTNYKQKALDYKSKIPNPQNLNNILLIDGLTEQETNNFKNLILELCTNYGLCSQSYVIYDGEFMKGIYLYEYIYKDWMDENPELVGHLCVVSEELPKNTHFNNFFTIEDKKDNLYLVRSPLW